MVYYLGWTDLEAYKLKSIYAGGVDLPARLALATPDTVQAIYALRDVLRSNGGDLVISDGYRSWETQMAAYKEYLASLKTAKPKPKRSKPGNSMHNAGRAIDFSLNDALKKIKLAKMWELMAPLGWYPIIDKPDSKISECWHLEHRSDFQKLYVTHGYTRMVRAAVCSVRGQVFEDQEGNAVAHVQYQLLRLGIAPNMVIDGEMGPTTKSFLKACHGKVSNWLELNNRDLADKLAQIDPGSFRF